MSEAVLTDTTQLTSELVEKLRKMFNERLVSVCLYGSSVELHSENTVSARPVQSFDEKKNVNVLVIIQDFQTNDLETVSDISTWWEKKAKALPLFLSEQEWEHASDVFALEYADIKDRHWLAYGKDLFSAIQVDTQSLRLICELEVYRKLIFLRQRLLLFKNNPEKLNQFLNESINTFTSIFRGIFRAYCPDKPVPIEATDLYAELSILISGFNSQPFHQVLNNRQAKQKPDKSLVLPLFKQYVDQISRVNLFLNENHYSNIE